MRSGRNPGPPRVERPRTRTAHFAGLVPGVACLGLAVFVVPRPARAQTAEAAGIEPVVPDLSPLARRLALVGAVINLLPAGVGADFVVGGASASPRFLLEWPMQIPLRWPWANYHARFAALSMHRLVVVPGLALGGQRDAATGAQTDASFHARAGYRLVFHPRKHALGAFVGAGTTVEFWPAVRASVGGELGAHVGDCCDEAAAILTVSARVDYYPEGYERVRVAVMVGWAFY